ncbi:MAG TPA: PepSY-associated TM helix domain-containing protein [Bryobacteraceae bacterium]|nr:PepSY-associated TM helix domain-containing protein [Bryobacteraceae bacterium]
MTFRDRALRRPQSLWLRKALFQIHLWTGIGLGLYVILISVSGSAIVFRNELYKSLWPGPKLVPISGPRLSKDGLKKAVRRAWPKYSVTYIWDSKRKDEATEVWMEKDGVAHPKTKGRLFDPYTGQDLGPSRPAAIGALAWLSDLHTNLLGGDTGRKINGLMAILVVILSVSGLLIWWPGAGRVRRSLTIDFRSNWKRLNWDLHTVIGFWMFAFVFIWGVTGVYLVFPTPFQVVVNHFSPLQLYAPQASLIAPEAPAAAGSESAVRIVPVADTTTTPAPAPARKVRRRRRPPRGSNGDVFLRWFYYLHFGNFASWQVKGLWVLLGLAPPFLFFTGALMWWNRMLSREARAIRVRRATPGLSSVAS